jgi:hypothetical protein
MQPTVDERPAAGSSRGANTGGPLALIVALLVLFPGSGGAGVTLAQYLAPGSWIAEAVGLFALPLAFVWGLQLWIGTALLGAVVGLLLGRRSARDRPAPGEMLILPGSIVFLPLSSAAGLLAGIVIALLPATWSALLSIVAFWAIGTVHGLAAWQLAKRGVLVLPDSA